MARSSVQPTDSLSHSAVPRTAPRRLARTATGALWSLASRMGCGSTTNSLAADAQFGPDQGICLERMTVSGPGLINHTMPNH